MKMLSMTQGLVVVGVVLSLAGCSSSSDSSNGGKCSAPVVTGTPFISSGTGTGSVHGSGTLPANIPDGQELELLVASGNSSVGVFPGDLTNESLTCGSSFTFTITNMDAGTYSLGYDVFDPSSQSTDPKYMGTSTNTFVVADGQSVAFNPTF